MKTLRYLVRFLLEKEIKQTKLEKEELLIEPDETEGRDENEVSSGGVAGVSVPLGAGPNYPNPTRRTNIRSPQSSAAASFGGASQKKTKK